MNFAGIYEWAHDGQYRTWAMHALQAFLIAAVTYGVISILPGEYSRNLRFGVGAYGAVMVFGHRELSDVIPAWVAKARASEAQRAEAQKHLTDKLVDGFGDFWSVPVGVGLFVLLVSFI